MSPRLSIIVPHYNDPEGLDACLAALMRQTLSPHEIIVADNNSPQGASMIAAVIGGRARLVTVTERGAGPARNGGVAVSSGDILAFTDSDCLPEPQWLQEGVAALEYFDVVGGAMEVLVEDEMRLTAAEAFERVFAFDNRDYVERKGFSVTANLFCARALFDDVGEFRVGVPEDMEWCHRASAAGYRIGYSARARTGHPARRTWSELVHKSKRLNEESFRLMATTSRGRFKWLIKALAMPLSAFADSTRPLTTSKLSKGRDRLAALIMLHRQRLWRGADYIRLLIKSR